MTIQREARAQTGDRRASGGKGRPRRRRLLGALAVVLTLALVLLAAGAWYFSGMVRQKALEVAPLHDRPNVVIAARGPGWVTVRRTRPMSEELAGSKVYGLEWNTGFGELGALRAKDGTDVTRALDVLSGTAPTAGTAARVTRDAYPRSPADLLGAAVTDVTYRSPGGLFHAYFAPGARRTWAVLVHGRGVTRTELFRLMRTTIALGMPSLDIAYRRDPENGGGLARFGEDEWRDLDAAVRYALDHGARDVVVLGTSMGGAITAAFLERSELAARVRAVVFDSAMLDFGAMIRHGSADVRMPAVGTHLPASLVWAATRLAEMRYGLDGGDVNYLDDLSWLKVPVLAFHGTDDSKVPASVTRRLQQASPSLVTAVLVEGAGHVESWNVDPVAYDERVRTFLAASLAIPMTATGPAGSLTVP